MPKQAIVVVLPSAQTVDLLVHSGALRRLHEQFEIVGLGPKSLSADLPFPLEKIDLSHQRHRLLRSADFHFWNFALFRYLHSRGVPPKASFKLAQLPQRYLRAYALLSSAFIHSLASFSDRNIVFRSDSGIERFLRDRNPALVVAPGSAIDTYSHMVLRTAAKLDVRSLMIVSHWDFFSKKGLLRTNVDKIYVWGEDMRRTAMDADVDEEKVRVLGAAQFERYRGPLEERRAVYRMKLGVSDDTLLVLFAGTLTPYDEIDVLTEMLGYLASTERRNVRVIYRPHPRAWKRKQSAQLDIAAIENLIVDDAQDTSAEHYTDLLAAIDSIVSPFSTMVLEAAVCGRPCLCIAFSDNLNDWDFSGARASEHLQQVAHRSWMDVCTERKALGESFARLLQRSVEWRERPLSSNDVKLTAYVDHRTYADRLALQIEEDFGLRA